MKLLVSALEPSSNIHLKELLKHLDSPELVGIFAEELGSPAFSPKTFSVMGILDVLPKVFYAKKAINTLAALAASCDKVLLIDAPAFNIPLAKKIKELSPHTEIIYYILPKVWAWKKGRVKAIERYCDKQLYIFPFEKEFYRYGEYVGNPLLDEIGGYKNEAAATEPKSLAFLPGSRRSEIKALMPVFKEVAARYPKAKKILAIPPLFSQSDIASLYGDISGFEVSIDARDALLKADAAVVCSGTATLEAALIGTPFVLVFKAKKLDYAIGRRFVKLKHVGLANILFDFLGREQMHPELLQERVNVDEIVVNVQNIDRQNFFFDSLFLRQHLKCGSSKRVADLIS